MVVPSLYADLVCVPMQALFGYESIEVYFYLNQDRSLEKRLNLLRDGLNQNTP
jgi:hypothetical protein